MARRMPQPSPLPRRCGAAALALLSLVLPVTPLTAQKNQQAAQAGSDETFFETMDVSVVNVDVFVTDRAGKPVHGLAQSDFVVYEDGKPVEITNFYAAEGGAIEGEGGAAAPDGAAPAPTPAAPAAPKAEVPDDQKLHLSIFIDNKNLSPRGRNEALKSVRSFLSTELKGDDRVLMVTYDGPGSLKVEQAAANDVQGLIAKLEAVASTGATGSFSGAEFRQIISAIERAPDPNSPDPMTADVARETARTLFSQIELFAQQHQTEVKSGLGTLGQFIDSLSGLQGRKAVLFVSGGMSMRPVQTLFDTWTNRYGSLDRELNLGSARMSGINTDVRPLFDKLAARANASRVTLYSLSAGDDVAVGSAETRSVDLYTREQAAIEQNNRAESMLLLASSTGGAASVGTSNYGSLLARLRTDMDSYYSLGFTPAQRRSGKDRRIKVETRNKEYRLRYRESYRDRTAQERMGEQTMSALLLGNQQNPLGVALEFEQEAPKGKNEIQVTLLVKFPMSGLVLLPQEKFHEGRVTMFVGVRDEKGRLSDLTQIAIPVRVPNDQVLAAMGQTVAYRTTLPLRAMPHTVAVGVRDEIGNVGSTVTASYAPGQAPPAAQASAAARNGSR